MAFDKFKKQDKVKYTPKFNNEEVAYTSKFGNEVIQDSVESSHVFGSYQPSEEVTEVFEVSEKANEEMVTSDNYTGSSNDGNSNTDKQLCVYRNIDAQASNIVGLSSFAKTKIFKPKMLKDVTPIMLENIVDSTGEIHERLLKMMNVYNITVLPLSECGVFEAITSIKDFEIVKVNGKAFASYTGLDFPKKYVTELASEIRDRIMKAQYYGLIYDTEQMTYVQTEESVLVKTVVINGKECQIPSLCKSEMRYLYTAFKDWNLNFLVTEDAYDCLIVGKAL